MAETDRERVKGMGIKQITKASLVLSFCSVLFASPVKAIDRSALYMLQSTMKEHGFDSGKPDGLIGPATRGAIAGFAEKYDLPEDPDDMIRELVSRSMSHSYAITKEANLSEAKLQEIKEEVGALLKDPSSVQIRNVRIAEGPKGRFYCGEVNGKNAFGAYAGFRKFNSLPGFMEWPTFYIENPNDDFVFWQCVLAIPKRN